MKRFLILACLFTSLFASVVHIPTVSAQTCEWSYTFDFSTGLHDWELEYGFYNGALQPQDTAISSENESSRQIRMTRAIPATVITGGSLTYHLTKGPIYSGSSANFSFGTDIGNIIYSSFSNAVQAPENDPLTLTNGGLSLVDSTELRLWIRSSLWEYASPQYGGDVGVPTVTLTGTGTNPFTGEPCVIDELMLPVKGIDSLHRDDVSEGDSQFVYIASDDYGAAVHAGVDGIIASVRPSVVSCFPGSNSDPFLYSKFCGGNMGSETLAVNAGEVYFVEIESSETQRRYTYIVKNAPVETMIPGSSVSAGCLIGYTFQTQSGPSVNQFGIAAAYVTDTQDYSLLEQFTVALVPNESCFKEPGYNECMGDYDLDDPSQWNASGSSLPVWGRPGYATLSAGASLSAFFNLDTERNPEVVVKARRSATRLVNHGFSIHLGDAYNDNNVAQTNWMRFDLVANVSTIGTNGITKVQVTTPGGTSLDWWEFDYICVRHTLDESGDPLPPPEDIGDPGSPDNDDDIPPDFEFNFTCEYLEAPESVATVQEWLAWHGDNFLTTYNCAVIPALEVIVDYLSYILDEITDFFDDVRDAIETLLDAIRYMMVLSYLGSDWVANDVIPYFSGYLANIAPTEITFNNGGGDTTCAAFDVFCFISNIFGEGFDFGSDLIDLLRQLFEEFISPILNLVIGWVDAALFSGVKILVGLVSLAVRVVGEILQFFQMGTDIVFGLVGMWNNATPQTLPGMWDCTINPEANGICWGLWVAENTVFSGPVGSLIIPLIVSVLYILVALNYVRIIRKMVADIGSSI